MDDGLEHPTAQPLPPPTPGTGRRRAISTAALAAGLVLGGFGIASAQTDTPDPTTPPAVDEAPAPAPDGEARPHLRFRMKGGPAGVGLMGGRGVLHGEFVVPDGDGEGYRTSVVQRGTVTAVDGSSVTVRSEDGFSATYLVDDDTVVNAGNEGIEDIEVDDEVHVHGFVVEGSDDPHAAHVVDETAVRDIHRRWHPRLDEGAGSGDAAA